jgi:error-prone DNA polymerase
VGQNVGQPFENISDEFDIDTAPPRLSMALDEQKVAGFFATGLYHRGPQPMAYHRAAMSEAGVVRTGDLQDVPDRAFVWIVGAVIVRQRPDPASGFIFISGEDESGIFNPITHPKMYEQNRMTVATFVTTACRHYPLHGRPEVRSVMFGQMFGKF